MRLACLKNIFPVLVLAVSLMFKICPAQEPVSFKEEINSDGINVRQDATVNSDIICVLKKGMEVEVVSEFFEWYKIRLPRVAPAFIKKPLTECNSYFHPTLSAGNAFTTKTETHCQNAKVLKMKVNIRLEPSESSAIIGTIDKDGVVNIVKEVQGWYQIEPTFNSFGWVNKKFIRRR